jgi:predicted protein tyrosine phosphatase
MIKNVSYTSLSLCKAYLESLHEKDVSITALISIREPQSISSFPYNKTSHHLILKFEDGIEQHKDYLNIGLVFEPIILFDESMGKNIVDFTDMLYKESQEYNLIVHCHQGISRSSAVAMAIAKKYNLDYNKKYKYFNSLVYSILEKSYGSNF